MAGLDNIKQYADGGDVEATPDTGAIQTTAPKSTGIAGKIALDPTQTEAILSNMQKYIDERSGGWNQFMGGINKAYATTYGPSAVAAFEQQKNQEDKQIMDYRSQMAAYRAAQAQAANEAQRYQGMTPTAGGTAGVQPSVGGVPISQEQLDIENSFGTAAEKLESRRKYLAGRNTEATKKEFSPAMANVVDVWVPEEGGMIQMTVAKAEQYLNANPKLQAIVNGKKVPAAQAISQASSATPAAGVPAFTDPSIKITSAKRTPEKGQELWNASVKNGTPGIQPNGLPVAKPGTSGHETRPAGEVLDIDPKGLSKTGRLELAQKGYYQPYGIDSPHWEKIPVASAPATVARPAQAPAAAPAQAPADQTKPLPGESKAQYEQRMKIYGQTAESRVKEGETERGALKDAYQSSIETGNSINRIESMLNTPEGVKAVGVFNKPGVVSAFGKILSEGVQAGNFGAVSFKGLEDAVRAGGGDQKTIDAAQSLARDFAQMQLNIAKRDLKGQGAVSDNERAIVAKVTGSTSNSPEVLKDFTRWNRVRNDFDRDVGLAYRDWDKAHPNTPFSEFKNSDTYQNLEKGYIAKTDAMASKMGLTGKGASKPSGPNKTDVYLDQYRNK